MNTANFPAMVKPLSYKESGVDIDNAEATKRDMSKSLVSQDSRVLNSLGAFASLFEARFPNIADPILVLKMEEPGSKQKLALQHGRRRSLCFDLINHLVNDIAVMGAIPLAALDTIVCGKIEREVVSEIVAGMAEACRELNFSLVGGETSEQPGVLEVGTYILSASIVGVVDRAKVVDGSKIQAGDTVIGVASNGLHTNGYSLVRSLVEADSTLLSQKVGHKSFLDAVLEPHLCYLQAITPLVDYGLVTGLAHITGGGVQGNLSRIIPSGLRAAVSLEKFKVLELFKFLQKVGNLEQSDMLKTFNMGVGLVATCRNSDAPEVVSKIQALGYNAYQIGQIEDFPGVELDSTSRVEYRGHLSWD